MRRSLIFSLILIAAVATPVMADVEPIGVIRPPTKPPRSVDFSGDHAVFGFYQANSTVEGDGAGLVKIYTADGSEWGLAANIQPDGLGERMWFGHDVAIQARTLVVGAPGDRWQDDRVGKVRVYDGWGDTWTVVDTLVSPDSAAADRYGVSLSLDGDLLAVGAIGANATYVYERAFGVWGITGSLEPSGEETDFGRTVEVSGSTIAIGSDQAVHVFVNSPAGWESQERIPTPGERWSDLNLDGDTLVFMTSAKSWKVKRLRRNKRCRVAACNYSGKRILGAWLDGTCERMDDAEVPAAYELLAKKYLSLRMANPFAKMLGRGSIIAHPPGVLRRRQR